MRQFITKIISRKFFNDTAVVCIISVIGWLASTHPYFDSIKFKYFPDSGHYLVSFVSDFIIENENGVKLSSIAKNKTENLYIFKGGDYKYGLPFRKDNEHKFSTNINKISISKINSSYADQKGAIDYFIFSNESKEEILSVKSDNICLDWKDNLLRVKNGDALKDIPKLVLLTPYELYFKYCEAIALFIMVIFTYNCLKVGAIFNEE